ncbi:DUF5681 domain-containing protein [Allosphingosinicella deserti]|uniref:DUF5681 domain-containing protein n=1 Tax=Allosphingosinicella deserti TaxID=2116704 RepID=A0A2P7QLL5_9SPHN|nr:DUF5681 domain-containing protein [Sphingomonas deserti]PSJ38845.1 hypothetical protein C7I55_16085 [Sphingomonas deserti]
MHDRATRTESGQFLPGQSGNPAGRPRGSRNRASVLHDLLEEGEAAAIGRLVVDRALAGDWAAMRVCFTRLFPPAKDAPVDFEMPEVLSAADAVAAGAAVIAAMGVGDITPSAAQRVMAVLAAHTRLLQTGTHKARVSPRQMQARPEPGLGDVETARRAARAAPPQRQDDATQAAAPACISPVVADESTPRRTNRAVAPTAPASAAPARSDDLGSCTDPVEDRAQRRSAARLPGRSAGETLYPPCLADSAEAGTGALAGTPSADAARNVVSARGHASVVSLPGSARPRVPRRAGSQPVRSIRSGAAARTPAAADDKAAGAPQRLREVA